MSHTLSQPEEVDLAIFEMNLAERISVTPHTEHDYADAENRKNWNCGYVSPYRAAHMNLLLH